MLQNEKKSEEIKINPEDTIKTIVWTIGIIVVAFFFVRDCACSSSSEVAQEQSNFNHAANEAYLVTCDLIKKRLKSPSTAKFPHYLEVNMISLGKDSLNRGERFFIQGYVDSQNGFGAMIRTNYSATVLYKPNERLTIENLEI